MPATTTLSRKILVFPSPTPAGLKLEGHVSDVHFTVSHRQPKLIAIDKQPDNAAAQPLSQKTSRYCWSSSFHVTWLLLLRWIVDVFGPSTLARSKHDFRHLGVDQQYPSLL
jgi:hypothetical protein